MAHHAKAPQKNNTQKLHDFESVHSAQKVVPTQERTSDKETIKADAAKENRASKTTTAMENEETSWQFYFVAAVIGVGVLLLIVKALGVF